MSFGFGSGRRCSVQDDCAAANNVDGGTSSTNSTVNASSEADSYALYEFAVDVTTVADAVYRWNVQDADTGRLLLECSTDANDPIGNRNNCTEAAGRGNNPAPGYYCACVPRRSNSNSNTDSGSENACRRVVFALPARGAARVAVDGAEVADFAGPPSDHLAPSGVDVAAFRSVTVGDNACPAPNPCLSDPSVEVEGESSSFLEIYLFRDFFYTGFNSLSIGLDSLGGGEDGPPASASNSNSNSSTNASSSPSSSSLVLAEREWNGPSLMYAGRCIPMGACHNLTVRVSEATANISSDSYWEAVPLAVTLDGVYYAHQDVYFRGRGGGKQDPQVLSYSTMLGPCTEAACAASEGNDNGIVSVTVDTLGAREDVPRDSWTWFLYDGGNGSTPTTYEILARDESQFRFGMGYPASSRFQTYVCLPPSATGEDEDDGGNITNRLTTFAMIGDVPDGVAVALEKNGEPLTCREPVPAALLGTTFFVDGMSHSSIMSPYALVTTPLDGTCASAAPLSAGAIAGIVVGALAGVVLLAIAAAHVRRRRARKGADDEKEAQTSPEGPAEA
jgi:hypothetical protein